MDNGRALPSSQAPGKAAVGGDEVRSKTGLQAGVVGFGWLLVLGITFLAVASGNFRVDAPVIGFLIMVMSVQTLMIRRRARRERIR